MKDIWRILGYVKFYRRQAVLAVLLAFAAAALASVTLPAFIPLFDMLFRDKTPMETLDWGLEKFDFLSWAEAPLRGFVENVLRNDWMIAMFWAVGLLVALNLLKGLATFFQAYMVGKVQTGISRRIAAQLYEHVLGLSMSFYNRKGTPSITARFANDVEALGRGLNTLFGKALVDPLRLFGFLGMAAFANWKLLLLNMGLFPAVGLAIHFFGRKARRAMRKTLHSRDRLMNILQETVGGISIVKAYNMEPRETGRFNRENDRVRRQDLKLVKVDAATSPLVEFIGFVGVGLSLVVAAYWVKRTGAPTQDVVLFYTALLFMADPVRKLSRVNNRLQMLRAASRRVFAYLDEQSEIYERPDARTLPPFSEEIRFENVYFTYNDVDTVLRGVNLVARKGEMIALVGPSGAGKSTVARLIARFWDPTSGRVTIDGVDLRDVTLESLRAQIGLVTQEVVLFNDTIASNIAYGRPDATLREIKEAAAAANAAGFIEDLPDGYESVAGDRGCVLSGGQRQRIALARAILKDPPILILDEATSSLDSESEHLIQEAMDAFLENRTSVVIAHRLSTIERATRIYVMDGGEILAEGTNEELLSSSPLYKKLHRMQFAAAEA